mgnify:CR=1 FL=1|tara:strand:+ start:224 stop:529 length:306 start_codon:yes stop_codon:yes gene_type:complete
MDILAIMEQFGIPVAVAMAFGFFIWKQNRFIQSTLMTELDQDFKRLEGIIIKLIDQQKKVQLEQKRLNGVFRAMVEIIARLSGNGLKDKFLRMMEKNNDTI